MKITIDVEKLNKLKITANQYCYLYSLYFNSSDSIMITESELQHLQESGYVKDGDVVVLRDKANKLFELTDLDKKFLEFWTNYPIKVVDKGKTRVLRTKEDDSIEGKECKLKYKKIVKSQEDHEKILKGLKNYVNQQMPYLTGVKVFLNQEIWKKYSDIDVDEVKKGTENKTQI